MKKAKKVKTSIEQALTAVKGLKLELSGALAEEEAWCKENLNPQTACKRSALPAAKIASAHRSRGKVSKPKSRKGRCCLERKLNNHEHYADSFQSV